jgi:hypothetical protein
MPNWNDVLREIQERLRTGERAALDVVRREYLQRLHEHTGRNVIACYTGFLSKPGIAQLEINDEDKNGFMMSANSPSTRATRRTNGIFTPTSVWRSD